MSFVSKGSSTFLRDIPHVDVDDVGRGVEIVVPDVFGDHRAGQDLVLVTDQVLEQNSLLGRERNRHTLTRNLESGGVESQIGYREHGAGGLGGPS